MFCQLKKMQKKAFLLPLPLYMHTTFFPLIELLLCTCKKTTNTPNFEWRKEGRDVDCFVL